MRGIKFKLLTHSGIFFGSTCGILRSLQWRKLTIARPLLNTDELQGHCRVMTPHEYYALHIYIVVMRFQESPQIVLTSDHLATEYGILAGAPVVEVQQRRS